MCFLFVVVISYYSTCRKCVIFNEPSMVNTSCHVGQCVQVLEQYIRPHSCSLCLGQFGYRCTHHTQVIVHHRRQGTDCSSKLTQQQQMPHLWIGYCPSMVRYRILRCLPYIFIYVFFYLFFYLRAVCVFLYIARENLVKNYIFTSLARKCSRCVLDESVLRGWRMRDSCGSHRPPGHYFILSFKFYISCI